MQINKYLGINCTSLQGDKCIFLKGVVMGILKGNLGLFNLHPSLSLLPLYQDCFAHISWELCTVYGRIQLSRCYI